MDRFSDKAKLIGQRRAAAIARYPALWSRIITEWKAPGPQDRAWLMYSANYLFRTKNIRWAIDPLTLITRIKEAPKVNVECALDALSFVLLTHLHNDHLDIGLIAALRHLPIKWVVPEFMLSSVMKEADLPPENIIIPAHLKQIVLSGIYVVPFTGLHWETTQNGTQNGVSSMGYLIQVNSKKMLFPGDTRTYDAAQLPAFGPVDHLFAHLWLGRGCALMEESPLTDAFCKFCLDLKPRRITVTHLNEFGRDANDLWDEFHARNVCLRFQSIAAKVPVKATAMGESILL